MYSIDQIRRGIRNGLESPTLLLREFNRAYHTLTRDAEYHADGVDVIEEDWDTLVVLDACRYDLFAAVNTLEGRLERKRSRGSHTSEFLFGNFDGRTLHDTVYTTASPQLERYRDAIDVEFHAVENVWNTDRWDEEVGTVSPEAMTEAALEVHGRYPNKRHVIHYMQPHYPFIDSNLEGDRSVGGENHDGLDLWEQRIRGSTDATRAEIWTAYRRNLELALDEVEELYDAVDGRLVITSDHGNMVGERSSPLPIREWGHPPRLYTEQLVTVPWLVREGETRRTIGSEPPVMAAAGFDSTIVDDRLRDLGYR